MTIMRQLAVMAALTVILAAVSVALLLASL